MFVARYSAVAWAAVVGFGSLALYVATLCPGIFLLDSGELTTAAHILGVAHPPGQPLYVILAKAVTLLPFGSVAVRVNLLSALFGAGALVLLYGLTLRAARGEDRSRDAWLAPAAAGGALVLAASPALWFQSVRAEVYTLNLALCLAPVFLLAHRPTAARLGLTALCLGLGLCNHHFLVVLATPAVLWLLVAHPAGRALLRSRALLLAVVVGLAALTTYALLPLRARLDPALNWSDASNVQGFFDMVTARIFQSSLDPGARAGIGENLQAIGLLFMDHLGPVVPLAGAAGLVLTVLRRPVVGVGLVLLLAGSVLSKALMFLDPSNPDAHGYFSAAMAVLCLGVAVFVGSAVEALAGRLRSWPGRLTLAVGLSAIVVMATAWQVVRHRDANDLSEFRSPDAFVVTTLGRVAPGALVMPYYYALQFTLGYAQLVEGRRPDVALVHQSFQGHIAEGRPYLRWLRRDWPGWADLADAFAERGVFPTSEVLDRARSAPIYVEPFTVLVVPPENLEPSGILARVRVPGPTARAGRSTRQDHARTGLLELLGDETHRYVHTKMFVLWYTFLEAALHVRRGDAAAADVAIGTGLAVRPGSRKLLRLGEVTAHLGTLVEQERRFARHAMAPLPRHGRLAAVIRRPHELLLWARARHELALFRSFLRDADVAKLVGAASQ